MADRRRFLWAAIASGPIGASLLFLLSRIGVISSISARSDLASLVVAVVVAPILEEIIFRGGLQEFLERRRAGPGFVFGGIDAANLATSVVFTLCHVAFRPNWLSVGVLIPSLLLGRIKQSQGSLLPC